MFAKSMNMLPKLIWRLFCKWPWPPITLTFAVIIKDSYFATFFIVTWLIPFNLTPNMLCFMVVFKMTLIFADFLAAILDMTSFLKNPSIKFFFRVEIIRYDPKEAKSVKSRNGYFFLGSSWFSHGERGYVMISEFENWYSYTVLVNWKDGFGDRHNFFNQPFWRWLAFSCLFLVFGY